MTAKPETAAEVLAEMLASAKEENHLSYSEAARFADRLERALSAQGEAVAWYAPTIDDTCTHAKKMQRARDGIGSAALFTVPLYTHPAPVRVTEEMVERALAQWFSDQYGRDDGPDSSWLAVQEEFEDGGERFRREMRAALTAALEDGHA